VLLPADRQEKMGKFLPSIAVQGIIGGCGKRLWRAERLLKPFFNVRREVRMLTEKDIITKDVVSVQKDEPVC